MRLLLVEDDERLSRGMEASLGAAGFAVDCLHQGADVLQLALGEPYSAIILDLGLPDMDGLDVLEQLRAHGVKTPVIILTARDMVDDRINGLDRGADDYMAKPFSPRELESRIRALVRRSEGLPDPVLRIGRLVFDRSSRTVLVDGHSISLRRRELAVLEALMARPGKVIAKERLAAEVFNFDDAVTPNALEVYVGRLRRKLEPAGEMIRTIRGFGYMIRVD